MLFKFVIISLMTLGAKAELYSDCGSQLAQVSMVEISGCKPDASECILKRNTNVSLSIDLTPSKDVKSIQTVVHGIIMDIPIPFPIPQPDACKDNGLTCPLKSGEKVKYRATFPVLKSYPKVRVDVKWELKTEDDGELVCILIAAKIA